MDLTEKGQQATVPPNVSKLQVFLNWRSSTPIDFDLIALGLKKGQDGSDSSHYELLTSFGKKMADGITLHEDAGVTANATGVYNEQADVDVDAFFGSHDEIYFGIIDYPNVQASKTGDFDDYSPDVYVMGLDASGNQVVDHSAKPSGEGMDGNAFMLAKMYQQGPVTRFEAVGSETILKGFTVDQLHSWVQGIRNS